MLVAAEVPLNGGELRTFSSLRAVGREAWNALVDPAAHPTLGFDWLDALEVTGCVASGRGWTPLHLGWFEAGRLVAAAPAYLKEHSQGEFVFDHGWARHAEARLGLRYYPKLVLAVPFTPVNGPRVLLAPGADAGRVLPAFGRAVVAWCERNRVSGAHVLFLPEAEAEAFVLGGFRRRVGVQFHWRNAGYGSFEDFLARFPSKRRHQLRRERRLVREQGLILRVRTGAELTGRSLDVAFACYLSTVRKFPWGRQYLSRPFFEEVAHRMPEQIHLVTAEAGERPVAAAFNLLSRAALYGRYWGALEERPFVHFEVCYYTGIEECIRRGLALFEPGAGGEHKLSRGFAPTPTHSVHWLGDPRLDRAVASFCEQERRVLEEELRRLATG